MLVNHSATGHLKQGDKQIIDSRLLSQSTEQRGDDRQAQVEASTLLEKLRWRSIHQPKRIAYRFLADQAVSVANSDLTVWTYHDLFLQVEQVAERLIARFDGTPKAQRILLTYQPGLELIAAFLGCLSVGVIAIPVPPPRRHESLARWQHILSDAKVSGILTTQALSQDLAPLIQAAYRQKQSSSIQWIVTDTETATDVLNNTVKTNLNTYLEQQKGNREDIAFLQYTSGSTSQPKGVMVTHGNLAHNLRQIQQAFGHSEQTQCVIWLPPYHDMGLIGGILQPLYGGYPVTLMSPASFLRRPVRWLEAISHFGGTTSGAPNFAYDYCVQKIALEDRIKLDLSTWQVAFTGAEPVQAQTLQRFTEAFSDCGFRASAFYPCYGLAEATLFVSGGSHMASPDVVALNRQALLSNRTVDVEPISHSPGAIENSEKTALVSCGRAIGQDIRIVNPQTDTVCEKGEIGEIWLAGKSVAAGYWNQARETQQVFQSMLPESDRLFLRTGDLGFVFRGELFVTGRLKDLIVIRGQNYYPQDIEQVIQAAHPGFASVSAAFSVMEEGKERLIVAQEVTRLAVRSLHKGTIKTTDMMTAIRSVVSNEFGLQVGAIALLKPGRIPRTTSGKVQRHRCKALFESDDWEAIDRDAPVHSADREKEQKKVAELLNWLRNYAHEHIDSRQMDERRCLSPGLILDFGNKGLLGMQVPEAYGGLGLGHRAMLDIIQQLGAIDLTLALFVGLNNVLGIRPILNYGSDELKEKWLPKLAAGRELAAFALTEAGAGSHPIGIAAQATPTAAGCWQLQGEKIWSGSAAWAGILNVFVQQVDEAGRPIGITGFAVERGTTGLRQGPEALTTGMRGMVQNTVFLNQVPVEASQQLGEAGAGMSVAQDAMRYGRLAIAAACAGGMKRCAQLMLRYAQRRQISTGRLLDNPVMLNRLSWLKQATALVESLVALTASRLDQSLPTSEDLYAVCKIMAPELYWQATDSLIQSLGGRGYIETNLAPQMMRDARVLRIFEGPTEVIAMHLGARTMTHPESLRTLFASLEQSEIGELLFETRSKIGEAHNPSAKKLSQYKLGKVAAWALSVATMKTTQAPKASVEWGQQQLEQEIEQALGTAPEEATALDAEQTTKWIEGYADSIGNVDSLAAISDLDKFLRPEPSAEPNTQPAVAPINPSINRSSLSQEKALTQWMRQWIAAQLNVDSSTIDPARTFADYGLDSVMAVELAEDLSQHLKLSAPLEATLAWNFPTISALAVHLSEVSFKEKAPKEKAPKEKAPKEKTREYDYPDYASSLPKPLPTPHTEELQQLSDEDLARALSAELAAMRGRNT